MTLICHACTTELLHFLTEYITWPCDLDIRSRPWSHATSCHLGGQHLC